MLVPGASLPALPPDPTAAGSDNPAKRPARRGAKAKILVVENTNGIRLVLMRLFGPHVAPEEFAAEDGQTLTEPWAMLQKPETDANETDASETGCQVSGGM